MEKIEKIILSMHDSNSIKRILVVTEDEIERYSTSDYSDRALWEIYTECVDVLKKEYKNDLSGLNDQEAVNKLASMHKIENIQKNLIIHLDYFIKEKRVFMYYENGTIVDKKISEENLRKLLIELGKIYDINTNELIIKMKKMGLISVVNRNKHNIRNLVVNHRVLSYIIALGMAGGIFGGIKLCKQLNNKSDINSEHIIPIETPYNSLDNSLTKKSKNVLDDSSNEKKEEKQIVNNLSIQEKINEFIKNNIDVQSIYSFIQNNLNEYNELNYKTVTNYLDNFEKSPYLTSLDLNNQEFIVLKTNKGYANILSTRGKQKKDGCFDTSSNYAEDIYADSKCFSLTGENMCKNVVATDDGQKIMQIMAKEILEGRTSIIRVNGPDGGRHFVLVVGLRKGYNKDNLKQNDFLIADPASAGLKILNTDFGGQKRYLYKTEDDKNWCGREGDTKGYMIALSNYAKEYISNEVIIGIVPWVTYNPEEVKTI